MAGATHMRLKRRILTRGERKRFHIDHELSNPVVAFGVLRVRQAPSKRAAQRLAVKWKMAGHSDERAHGGGIASADIRCWRRAVMADAVKSL